jgi:hypothetical protein
MFLKTDKKPWARNDLMVTAAHRYCLGRKTYMVSECVEWLIDFWRDIDIETRKRIQQETKEAIQKGLAGDICDIRSWERILKLEVDSI